jgi:hypothetical protein
MKTFQLNIASPCEENLDKMPKNAQGFFCNSCAKSVIDLSNKTDYEISRIISSTKDKNNICARLNASQINKPFELFDQPRNNSSLKYASAIAASVLLSTGVAAQENTKSVPNQTESQTIILKEGIELGNEMAEAVNRSRTVSFTLKGKLIDGRTGLPFVKKLKPKIFVKTINGEYKQAKINKKTSEFEIEITQYITQINLIISTQIEGFAEGQQAIPFDFQLIKNNVLETDIVVFPEINHALEWGGIGFNLIDNKNNTIC